MIMNLKLSLFKLIFALICIILFTFNSAEQSKAQSVKVTLPAFPVTMNEINIDSNNRQYPFIVYKDITYFPMTWHDSRLLGLETNWTPQAGLEVKQTGHVIHPNEYKIALQNWRNSVSDYATIASLPITVNGQTIHNATEPYPLLLYRNVTYFPLTWRFGFEAFKWGYEFTNQGGLNIESVPNYITNHRIYENYLSLIPGWSTKSDVQAVLNEPLKPYIPGIEYIDHSSEEYYQTYLHFKVNKLAPGQKEGSQYLNYKSYNGPLPAYIPKKDVTLNDYLKVENGMSLQQVNETLGMPGYLSNETSYSASYNWNNVVVTFTKSYTPTWQPIYSVASKSLTLYKHPASKNDVKGLENPNVTLDNLDLVLAGLGQNELLPYIGYSYNKIVEILGGEGHLIEAHYSNNTAANLKYLWVGENANLVIYIPFSTNDQGELEMSSYYYYPMFE